MNYTNSPKDWTIAAGPFNYQISDINDNPIKMDEYIKFMIAANS
jgi:hypothetical protein